MKLVQTAIKLPVTVSVIVLLVALFGFLGILRIPVQLTPNVDKPIITVTTRWLGASPQEVEREIVEEQEELLKGTTNLKKMTSASKENEGQVTLEFYVGADKNNAMREVSDKLRQVSEYPPEADEPVVEAVDTNTNSYIAWMILQSEQDDVDVTELGDFIDDYVKPYLERVEGVAQINVFGGRQRELQVKVDPARLAARGLRLTEVRDALQAQNRNISAGTLGEGKRDYIIRTVGEFETTEQVASTVIRYDQSGPVYVRDVAEVNLDFKKRESLVRSRGDGVVALAAKREVGSNVMAVMASLRRSIDKVNLEVLRPRQLDLSLTQVYDETSYIRSAIRLVLSNLLMGGGMAVAVLLIFLRSMRATGVVALSIPIAVVGTFLVLSLLGRNLNVISLAGMAFAVGMVVDNAIVVVENIFRHVDELGKSRWQAAYDGTVEVWGATLASTLTTVAVFVPIIFVQEEAGQLFRDIAIAVSVAVTLSLLVSITVIPTMSARLLRIGGREGVAKHKGNAAARIASLVQALNRSTLRRCALVVVLVVASLGGSRLLAPAATYLPEGNRNLIFAILIPPPGYNLEQMESIGRHIESTIRPFWENEDGSRQAQELQADWHARTDGSAPPLIDNFFFVAHAGMMFMGCTSREPTRVAPLVGVFYHSLADVPGVIPIVVQSSLFGRGISVGNTIDLELSGADLAQITSAASQVQVAWMMNYGTFPRPIPGNYNLPRPEVRAVLHPEKAAELGLNVRDVGFMIEACVDGALVGDYRHESGVIDMALVISEAQSQLTQDLEQIPIFVGNGRVVPVGAVAEFINDAAVEEIQHIEEQRSVTLQLTPPAGMPLSAAMRGLEEDILATMRQDGRLSPAVSYRMAGEADKLVQTFKSLRGGFLLALLISYLLMAALFENWLYPLLIMISVPLALVGGFLGLRILHLFTGQQMDSLTMLGFIILIGIVVNNAILIVHQAINNMGSEMDPHSAVTESVRTRVRPIFMSTATSVFGMLPLVLMPGAGSELYRGLGSVVVGGLAVATLFTLLLVPALFTLVLDFIKWFSPSGKKRREPSPAAESVTMGDSGG